MTDPHAQGRGCGALGAEAGLGVWFDDPATDLHLEDHGLGHLELVDLLVGGGPAAVEPPLGELFIAACTRETPQRSGPARRARAETVEVGADDALDARDA